MGRSALQNQRTRDRRRGEILSGALRLFVSKGLAATRVGDIARAAGVSQGLLYHYFASKEDIYVALIRTAFERLNEAARGLEAMAIPPREKIELAVTKMLEGMQGNEDYARYFILTAQASLLTDIPREAARIVHRERDLSYGAIARILRAGQADGSIRDHDADELAVLFWTVIKGLAMHRAAFGKKFVAPDPALLTHMFAPEGSP